MIKIVGAALLGALSLLKPSVALATDQVARMAPEFAKKFEPLQKKLLAEDEMFSGSKMYDDLKALETAALRSGAASAEVTRLYAMLSLLQYKRSEYEEAASFGERAIKANVKSNALNPDEITRLHDRLSEIYQADGEFSKALPHIERAVMLSAAVKTLNEGQRLGLRQSLGYVLHETKQYARALENNRNMLADAEKVYGADGKELLGVIINIAQNSHALNDPRGAEPMLQRALRIARANANTEREFDITFQLGVLAYEGNDDKLARSYFETCLRIADKAQDEGLQAKARGYLEQLKRKSPARKP
ncbi:MAG: tetratricopeptide repeat protein [Casimicrobium sp.]